MLMAFFTAVYFYVSVRLIDLLFRNTLSVLTDLLSVVCLVIALVVSVGLADFTVKRIRRQ